MALKDITRQAILAAVPASSFGLCFFHRRKRHERWPK
jgi:hypothetical protein